MTTQPTTRPRSHAWRAAVAAVLIVLAGLLTPVAMIATWAKVTLTDTDAFVNTYAPVISDPAMQTYLTDQVSGAIVQQLNIEQIVGEAVDAPQSAVGDRPRASAAIGLLQQPAVDGLRGVVTRVSGQVIAADATATAWQQALRVSHGQAIGALSGDPATLTAITGQGLGLRLDPIVERVRTALLERGWALAARIPPVDTTITIMPASGLQNLQQNYRLAVALGTWLPWLVVVLVIAGVLTAGNHRRAVAGSGLAVALGAGGVLGGLALVRALLPTYVPASVLPNDVTHVLLATVTNGLSDVAAVACTLGIVVAFLGWLTGVGRTAHRLRAAGESLGSRLRTGREALGLSTGRLGRRLHSARVWVCVVVIAGAMVYLLANRPLSAGLIIGTLAVAVAVLALASLLLPAAAAAGAGHEQTPVSDS